MESQEIDVCSSVRKLQAWDSQAIAEVIESRGETTIVIPREHLRRAAEYLAAEPSLRFSFLSDIAAVDRFPMEPRFEVNYQLLSLDLVARLRLKVRLPGNDPVVASVTSVWPTANWHERENFDLFGIRFEGHPDLRRIVMPDEWEGYPLRKDYPTEGYR
ncbi:MAG TPA: NADH-quinone oxidoreductase subunit C [Candidatus Acidoferrales bacterium]|nr:NADH-quinone oxidoreductase subunit C [Candidatus Acidoferrales bacterium]